MVKDETGLNNGAVVGQVTFNQGGAVLGGSSIRLNADGNPDGAVDVPNSPTVAITGPVTAEGWINLDSPNATANVVEKYDIDHYQGYGLRVVNGQVAGFVMDAANWTGYVLGATPISPRVWHSIVMTADGTTVKVYLDGTLDGQKLDPRLPTPGSSSLKLGALGDRGYLWGGTAQYIGLLAEVALYSKPISAAQVAAHYAASGRTSQVGWVTPPTPLDQTHFVVRVGGTQSFTMQAQAIGLLNLTIAHSQLPAGVTCIDTANPGNPATVDCTVAPTASGFFGLVFDAVLADGTAVGTRTYVVGAGRYVALGDSYSSGEGNPPFDPLTDKNGDSCHRSAYAYPRLLAPLPEFPGGVDYGSPLTPGVDHWACSGAKTDNVLNPNQTESSQLSHLGSSVTLVTITVGGNNVGFPDVAQHCIVNFHACAADQDHIVQPKINELRPTGNGSLAPLEYVYQQIRHYAPNARILVIGYPHFFPPSDQFGHGLRDCAGIGYEDQPWINAVITELNQVIQLSAENIGAEYVDVYNAYVDSAGVGHELCNFTNATEWMNGRDILSPTYSFHPNNLGHVALARLVQKAFDAGPPGLPLSISLNETIVETIAVGPGQAFVTFSTTWPGSDVVMSLVSPSGRIIDRTIQAADVMHQLGPTHEVYTLTGPEPGAWSVKLYGANVGQNGEIVTFYTRQSPPIHQPPIGAVTESVTSGKPPLQVLFDATASKNPNSNGTITSYSWNFGDGTTGSGPTVSHIYTQRGMYFPHLSVTDDTGAVGYASGAPINLGGIIYLPIVENKSAAGP